MSFLSLWHILYIVLQHRSIYIPKTQRTKYPSMSHSCLLLRKQYYKPTQTYKIIHLFVILCHFYKHEYVCFQFLTLFVIFLHLKKGAEN